MSTTPFRKLREALHSDEAYAWGWHCNLAMCILDELHVSHTKANYAAARIMQHVFNIDITKNPCWGITVKEPG